MREDIVLGYRNLGLAVSVADPPTEVLHSGARAVVVRGGELTPTLKIRRKVIEEKYRDRIDSLYPHSGRVATGSERRPMP